MARPDLRQLSLVCGLFVIAACHEVVALDPPPLDGAASALLVALDPDGEPQFHADGVPLQGAPIFRLGSTESAWAFGFRCDLARLDLEGRSLTGDNAFIPELPAPSQSLAWSDSAWVPVALQRLPSSVRSLFPPADELSPCRTYAASIAVEERQATTLNPSEGSGGELLQIVPDGQGGALAIQNILQTERSSFIRVGSQWIKIDPNLDLQRISTSSVPQHGVASRGGGDLVFAGRGGLFEGQPDSLRLLARLGPHEEAAELRIATSPTGEEFEAFVLALDQYPSRESATPTLTLLHVRDGSYTELHQRQVTLSRFLERFRVPQVIRSGPGRGYATGFLQGGNITRFENGQVLEGGETVVPGIKTLRALRFHPEVGVVVTDTDGATFLRPIGHRDGTPWLRLAQDRSDVGPLLVDILDGEPVVVMRNRTGLRLIHVRPSAQGPRACEGLQADYSQAGFGLSLVQSETMVAVEVTPDNWWIVNTDSGIDRPNSMVAAPLQITEPAGICDP